MSLTPVLFLFLCHLSIGIVFTLVLIPRAAGAGFFRFTSALAFIFLVLGISIHPEVITFSGDAQGVAFGGLVVPLVALPLIVAPRNAWRRHLLWLSATAGVVTLLGQAATMTSAVPLALTMASFLTSAALLGSSFTATILGHWYLVLPSMDVSLLQRTVMFHLGSTLARTVVVAAVALAASVAWNPRLGPSFGAYVFSIDGIFLWQRVLFGLFGPGVLAYLTWETAKIRSTQSATGILFVDFFTVMMGELVAKYLLFAVALPF